MPDTNKQYEEYYARDRQEWRAWLEQHATTSPGIWLVYYKKHTNQPFVKYEDAVEEALCFGWIDSKPNVLDAQRYKQLFSPRKPKSPWSKINKQRVEKLLEQGLMTPAGLKAIEIAKQNGMWNVYDAIEEQTVPQDFAQALAANVKAQQNFESFSNSTRKQLLWHIESAKRPETRAKRIEQIVTEAEQNRNPLNYTANKKNVQ